MRTVLIAAAVMGAAVALGAFGAHGLEARLEAAGHQDTWSTAVLYQSLHGLALLGLGIWQAVDGRVATSRAMRMTSWLWTAGVLAFSGSLYLLSLGGPKWLGPITPLGGLCFLAGWTALAVGAWQLARTPATLA